MPDAAEKFLEDTIRNNPNASEEEIREIAWKKMFPEQTPIQRSIFDWWFEPAMRRLQPLAKPT